MNDADAALWHGTKTWDEKKDPPDSAGLSQSHGAVNTVEPAMPPEFAPIVVVPAAMQFAAPATLGAFAIVATVVCEELQ